MSLRRSGIIVQTPEGIPDVSVIYLDPQVGPLRFGWQQYDDDRSFSLTRSSVDGPTVSFRIKGHGLLYDFRSKQTQICSCETCGFDDQRGGTGHLWMDSNESSNYGNEMKVANTLNTVLHLSCRF